MANKSTDIQDLIDRFIEFDFHYKDLIKMYDIFELDKRKHEICDRLNVPYELWFIFKENVLSLLTENKNVFDPLFDNKQNESEYSVNSYDFSKDFGGLKLGRYEKLFIVLHKVLKNRYNEIITKIIKEKYKI